MTQESSLGVSATPSIDGSRSGADFPDSCAATRGGTPDPAYCFQDVEDLSAAAAEVGQQQAMSYSTHHSEYSDSSTAAAAAATVAAAAAGRGESLTGDLLLADAERLQSMLLKLQGKALELPGGPAAAGAGGASASSSRGGSHRATSSSKGGAFVGEPSFGGSAQGFSSCNASLADQQQQHTQYTAAAAAAAGEGYQVLQSVPEATAELTEMTQDAYAELQHQLLHQTLQQQGHLAAPPTRYSSGYTCQTWGRESSGYSSAGGAGSRGDNRSEADQAAGLQPSYRPTSGTSAAGDDRYSQSSYSCTQGPGSSNSLTVLPGAGAAATAAVAISRGSSATTRSTLTPRLPSSNSGSTWKYGHALKQLFSAPRRWTKGSKTSREPSITTAATGSIPASPSELSPRTSPRQYKQSSVIDPAAAAAAAAAAAKARTASPRTGSPSYAATIRSNKAGSPKRPVSPPHRAGSPNRAAPGRQQTHKKPHSDKEVTTNKAAGAVVEGSSRSTRNRSSAADSTAGIDGSHRPGSRVASATGGAQQQQEWRLLGRLSPSSQPTSGRSSRVSTRSLTPFADEAGATADGSSSRAPAPAAAAAEPAQLHHAAVLLASSMGVPVETLEALIKTLGSSTKLKGSDNHEQQQQEEEGAEGSERGAAGPGLTEEDCNGQKPESCLKGSSSSKKPKTTGVKGRALAAAAAASLRSKGAKANTIRAPDTPQRKARHGVFVPAGSASSGEGASPPAASANRTAISPGRAAGNPATSSGCTHSRKGTPERTSRQQQQQQRAAGSRQPSPSSSRQASPGRGATPPGFHSFKRSAAAATGRKPAKSPEPQQRDPRSSPARSSAGGFAFAAPTQQSIHKSVAGGSSSGGGCRGLAAAGQRQSEASNGRSTGGGSSIKGSVVPQLSKFPRPTKASAASPEPRNVPWENSLR